MEAGAAVAKPADAVPLNRYWRHFSAKSFALEGPSLLNQKFHVRLSPLVFGLVASHPLWVDLAASATISGRDQISDDRARSALSLWHHDEDEVRTLDVETSRVRVIASARTTSK